MTTETVEIAVALWYDTARERRFIRSLVLPHTIRYTRHDTHDTHDTHNHRWCV
jgi:hypothetical protein